MSFHSKSCPNPLRVPIISPPLLRLADSQFVRMVAPKKKVKDRDGLVDRTFQNTAAMVDVGNFKVYRVNISGRSKPSDLGKGRKLDKPNVDLENPVIKKNDGKTGTVMDKTNGAAGVSKDRNGRKPLADVSNTRITSSRRPFGFPKPMHGKTESVTLDGFPERKSSITSNLARRKCSIPTNLSMRKSSTDTCLPVGKLSIAATTLSRKDSKGYSDKEIKISRKDLASNKGDSKFQINCSKGKINDGEAANLLPSTMSKIATKQVKQPNQTLNNIKDAGRNPEKNVGNVSSSVKVGRKVLVGLARGSKNNISRNHFVDDTKLMHLLPVKNLKIDGNASCRMLVSNSLKTGTVTHQYSKHGVTIESKATTRNEKKTTANDFTAESSFMNMEKKEASETRFDNASGNVTTNVFKTKNRRRKSYTSMLVEGSKGDIPSIDDSRNQLEVAEYVTEIYQYYWNMEVFYPFLGNYTINQTEVTSTMRATLINWLMEVHLKFELMEETLFLMVQLLDRFLSESVIRKDEIQLVGITALLLASKYEDYWHPKISDLISISFDLYTRDQVLAMEKHMLKKLRFRLNFPTPYVFMLRFLKAGQSDKKLKHLAFYLIELCLVKSEALEFKASLLCASAIYIARCTLQRTPRWTKLLVQHTHYEESHIKCCADMILGFQRTASKDELRVTYAKYLEVERDGVAKIKPIPALPI